MRAIRWVSLTVTIVWLAAGPAAAELMQFRLLPNQSRATFKIDAPLETMVGTTAADGLTGTLAVDPAKPQGASGSVRVDMALVRSGVDKRDADMLGKTYLDVAAAEANRFVTFEVRSVEIGGPLEPGKEAPARVSGILTIKQKPLDVVADARVTYVKLTAGQLETQRRFGFAADNVKVRAKVGTTFTNHGMQVPQLLTLKVANDIQIETDLIFVRQ